MQHRLRSISVKAAPVISNILLIFPVFWPRQWGPLYPVLEQTLGQAEIVSSEHVGDELHFRMSIPLPGMSGVSGVEMPDVFHKIRKENGMWRIYDLP